jgi:ketosteroid isomerase-like protein
VPGENVEIVMGMLRAWAGGERDAARSAYDPHVVCILPTVDDRVSYGIDAVERANEAWRRSWSDFRVESGLITAAGDQVVVRLRQSGTGAESGVAVALETFGVVSLRNGRIIRLEFFNTQAEALAAAGLTEQG